MMMVPVILAFSISNLRWFPVQMIPQTTWTWEFPGFTKNRCNCFNRQSQYNHKLKQLLHIYIFKMYITIIISDCSDVQYI